MDILRAIFFSAYIMNIFIKNKKELKVQTEAICVLYVLTGLYTLSFMLCHQRALFFFQYLQNMSGIEMFSIVVAVSNDFFVICFLTLFI